MRVLGIDTASLTNAVGLIEGDHIMADLAWEARDNSLQRIISNTDRALKRGGLALEEIDGLAVGIGPGSWTGVRIGVTVAKTLAYALDRPICGISSLEALAYQARSSRLLICSLVDAGKGNVYAAFYRAQGRAVVMEGNYYVGGIGGLAERVTEPVLFVGKPAHLHRPALSGALGPMASFGSPSDSLGGHVIALVSLSRFASGAVDDALSLVPLYLGESLAQALLHKKETEGADL